MAARSGLLDDALAAFANRVQPKPEANAAETDRAELSLLEFSRQAWSIIRPGDKWVDGWVFGCICEHIQALYRGQIRKLGIAVPPRHGKSLAACVFAPVWEWIQKPTTRFIFVAYSQRFANRDSMACRELIKSPWFQDRWGHRFTFKEDINRQDQFNNDRGGFRIAATPGGGTAMGEGGDVLFADDITSIEQSFSPTALETAFRFWTQTMTLRFHDPEAVLRGVSMQRSRKTDLLGRLIAENFGYEVLTLPFQAEPSRVYFLPAQKSELGIPADPEGTAPPKHAIIPTSLQVKRPELRDEREAGEILWPERFRSEETIKDLKASVKTGAAGQLQQRPEDDAGAVFKPSKFKLCYPFHSERGLAWLMSSEEKARVVYADECFWYQTCDTAMKAEQANDPTAFATVAKSPFGDLIVRNIAALRLLIPEQWPAMKQFRDGEPEWEPERREWRIPGRFRPWPKPLAFQSVESKNSGIGLLQVARSEGRPLKELEADANKVLRAATIAQLYESGCVYHDASGAWRGEFEDELTSFPAGAHDDMVDCIAYAGILFVHDNLVAAYKGDVVYNDRVHAELDAHDELQKAANEGAWIPPHLRPNEPVAEPQSIDEILAALQGRPVPKPPALHPDGRIRDEFLHDED